MLTENQKQCVHFSTKFGDTPRHLGITAGAGAGKTHVLIARISHLIQQKILLPRDVCVVTFTNDAATELQHRLKKNATVSTPLDQVAVSTIDSFFAQLADLIYPEWILVHKNNDVAGQNAEAGTQQLRLNTADETIFSLTQRLTQRLQKLSDSPKLLGEVMDFFLAGGFFAGTFLPQGATLSLLARLCLNEKFLTMPLENIRFTTTQLHPATQKLIAVIHTFAREEHINRLLQGEILFSDRTVFLLENLKESPTPFHELIVDEYQDTNLIQHTILSRLVTSQNARMIVVGDPKQSIYGFRGANVSVFQSLLEDKNWRHLTLNENFRSHPILLGQINKLSDCALTPYPLELPPNFPDSYFYREAHKKYVPSQKLYPGRPLTSQDERTRVYFLAPSLHLEKNQINPLMEFLPPGKNLKLNEFSMHCQALFIKKWIAEKGASDLVFLCETRKQIKELQDIFQLYSITLCSSQEKKQHEFQRIFFFCHALLKTFFSMESRLEQYMIGTFPFLRSEFSWFQNDISFSFFDEVKAALIPFQKKCPQERFFILWKKILRNILKDEIPLEIQAYFDTFHQRLFAFCEKVSMQNSISNFDFENPGDFPFPEKNEEWNFPTFHTDKQTQNAIPIQTVHGAKGLQWKTVVFYPRYVKNAASGVFHISEGDRHLDLNWLNEDRNQMSMVSWIKNEKFLEQDCETIPDKKKKGKEKKVWYSPQRRQLEENYERQRVFYTAFTRAEENLILFQPQMDPLSKKGLLDLANQKPEQVTLNYEKKVFLEYLNSTESCQTDFDAFSFQNSWNFPLQIVHFDLKACEYLKEILWNSPVELTENTEKSNPKTQTAAAFPMMKNILEKSEHSCHLLPDLPKDLVSTLQERQGLQQRSLQGIHFHQRCESFHPQKFMHDLFSTIPDKIFYEYELWNLPSFESEKNRSLERKIIDIYCIFTHTNPFHTSPKITEETHEKSHIILEIKSGKFSWNHVKQVQTYTELLENKLNNLKKREIIFGILVYKNRISDQLHFQKKITPQGHTVIICVKKTLMNEHKYDFKSSQDHPYAASSLSQTDFVATPQH